MIKFILIALFIIGALFFNASRIGIWFLSGEKPTHSHWKLYGFIGAMVWIIILILANTIL